MSIEPTAQEKYLNDTIERAEDFARCALNAFKKKWKEEGSITNHEMEAALFFLVSGIIDGTMHSAPPSNAGLSIITGLIKLLENAKNDGIYNRVQNGA